MDDSLLSAKALAVLRLAPLGPEVGALSHVVGCVSAFLDYSARWSMEKAVERERWGRLAIQIEELKRNEHMSVMYKRHLPVSAMEKAARKGRVDVLQRLVEAFRCPMSPEMLVQAAHGGHVGVAEWVYEVLSRRSEYARNLVFSLPAVEIATRKGMWDFVELMLEHAVDRKRSEAVSLVVKITLESKQEHILEWVVGRFPAEVGAHAIDMAASMGFWKL